MSRIFLFICRISIILFFLFLFFYENDTYNTYKLRIQKNANFGTGPRNNYYVSRNNSKKINIYVPTKNLRLPIISLNKINLYNKLFYPFYSNKLDLCTLYKRNSKYILSNHRKKKRKQKRLLKEICM
jgi:hypothetical protein